MVFLLFLFENMIFFRLKIYSFFLISLLISLISLVSNAQFHPQLEAVNDTLIEDDLEDVTDQFQELFFKALAESGVENYERAIEYFEKSLALAPDSSVVYFQLGKNYEKLERPEEAIENYHKARKGRPDEDAILFPLLTLYQLQGNPQEALQIAQKLVPEHPDYYMDLAELERLNQNEVKALEYLNTFEQKKGETPESIALRQRIYREAENPDALITYFTKQVEKKDSDSQNYKALVQLYYLHDNLPEAYIAAQKLKELDTKAIEISLGLYPHYIEAGETDPAVRAMELLIQNDQLNKNIKMNVIKDFTHFVKKYPEYEDALISILGEALNEGRQSNLEMANYYKTRDKKKALNYYEKAVQENPQDYGLIKETILLQLEGGHYKKTVELTDHALQYFPTQAFLYLAKGKAQNRLDQYEKAEENLLDGVDFVIEDKELLRQFYEALIETYTHLKEEDQLQYYTEQLGNLKI